MSKPSTLKVRCVGYKQEREKYFTLGKVYEWVNNTLINDNGDKYSNTVQGTNPADWKLSSWYTFEVVKEKEKNTMKIVITSDGETTLARLYDGKNLLQKAKAVCSSDDEFDFRSGAKLAMERLMNIPDAPKHSYYSGKAVCISKGDHWMAYTVGKVYEFKDGRVTIDNGITVYLTDSPVTSIEEWNKRYGEEYAKFIPFVE